MDIGAKLDGVMERLDRLIEKIAAQQQEERMRGIKWMRLPTYLQGKAIAGVLNLGPDSGQPPVGPDQGYLWSLRRLVVDGLTIGATPDVVNLYRGAPTGQPPLWQFNGNNFGYEFGKLVMVLMPGDTLALQNAAGYTFAASGVVRLSGELLSVPAEMLGKLV